MKADAILVGDVHYRDSQPPCRLDDFWGTQKRKALWLRTLWEKEGKPPVLQPGDLFHHWKSSPRAISAVLEYLPPMITMPGNPGRHNYFTAEGFERDALNVIKLANTDWVVISRDKYSIGLEHEIDTMLWGEEETCEPSAIGEFHILMSHKMILDGPAPFDGEHGLDFLKRMTGYDLIVTGHNHKPMMFVHKKRLLVNPGSFTRQTADETHEPRVYLWYAKENEIKPVYVPIEKDVITREHIDSVKIPDQRIVAFVESLAEGKVESTIRFVDNMMQFIENPKLKQRVRDRLLEAIDNG